MPSPPSTATGAPCAAGDKLTLNKAGLALASIYLLLLRAKASPSIPSAT